MEKKQRTHITAISPLIQKNKCTKETKGLLLVLKVI
jgi:hypothetical protein